MHTYPNTYKSHVHIKSHKHIHTITQIYTYMHTHTNANTLTQTHISYILKYIYIHSSTDIYTHTHTNIITHTNSHISTFKLIQTYAYINAHSHFRSNQKKIFKEKYFHSKKNVQININAHIIKHTNSCTKTHFTETYQHTHTC